MLLIVLSLIDLIAGLVLLLCEMFSYADSYFVGILGVVIMLKGLWSIATAATSNFYFDIAGMLDVVSGIFIILTTFSIFVHFFVYAGIALILKGAYSMIMGLR